MFQRLALLCLTFFAVGLLTLSTGCVEEPKCREACEHTCDLCDSGCSDGEIDTCTQSCEDSRTDPERTDCVLSTDLCEDLWKC